VWERRFGTPPASPQERAKQMRFLAGRGFDGDVIRRVVQGSDED
jgi:regulatory protein